MVYKSSAIENQTAKLKPTAVISSNINSSLQILLKNIAFKSHQNDTLPAGQENAIEFPACSSPDIRSPPQFQLEYRKSLAHSSLLLPGSNDVDTPVPGCPDFYLSCTKVVRQIGDPVITLPLIDFYAGVDLIFNQMWNLVKLKIGDLSSTISLAPSEQLTLEFLSSQRKLLEQTTMDSTEEMNSIENTVSDKEIVNVARSSAKTENWNASANGGINLGFFSIGGGGSSSGSTTENIQNSMQHITESTKKSSQSLKVLHKIEIRGVTETFIQNRMTRIITNPYNDRTLTLNVFQLLKHFATKTGLKEIRPSLIIQPNKLQWDNNFIVSHADFLKQYLIDSFLVDDLPNSIKGATSIPPPCEFDELVELSKKSLAYLFQVPNIFKVLPILIDGNDLTGGNLAANPNLVETSLDPFLTFLNGDPNGMRFHFPYRAGLSGFGFAVENDLAKFYTILKFLHDLYYDFLNNPNSTSDKNLIAIAFILNQEIDKYWNAFTDKEALKKLLNYLHDGKDMESYYVEIYRRLSGFNSMYKGLLQNKYDIVKDWMDEIRDHQKSSPSTSRLLAHLECNMNYYIQKFLLFIDKNTEKQGIIDFVNQIINSTNRSDPHNPMKLRQVYDVHRAYIDGQQIVVPAFNILPIKNNEIEIPLGNNNVELVSLKDILPIIDNEVDVPLSDGIHLEVAPGGCILKDLPDPEKTSREGHDRDRKSKMLECIPGLILSAMGLVIVSTTTYLPQSVESLKTVQVNGIPLSDIVGLGITSLGAYLLKGCGKMPKTLEKPLPNNTPPSGNP